MRNRIMVKVVGPANSGCTTIALIIQEALQKAGFDNNILLTDSNSLCLADKQLQQLRIEAINKSTEVVVEETHIRK